MDTLQQDKSSAQRLRRALFAVVVASSAPAAADPTEITTGGPSRETCWGAMPTIVCAGGACVGTAGPDVILGSNVADQIYAAGGNDIVCGAGGNDRIYGGSGADNLFGQGGGDTIYGESGPDHLHGNDGADVLYGGSDADRVYGGEGTDSLYGQDGDDRLMAGNHDDNVRGGDGADTLYGEAGNDTLRGDGANDTIYGGDGSDYAEGGANDDRIFGQRGSDELHGQEGRDAIAGGDANDALFGGPGDDELDGDAGDDDLFGDDGDDRLYGDVGLNDACDGGAGTDEHVYGTSCEWVASLELPAAPDEDEDGGNLGAPCEFWEQDCNDGLKCTSGGPDQPFTCGPLADNPDQVGDTCSASEDSDSCDVGSLCIHGVCVALCGGTPANPLCATEAEACHFYDDGPALCEAECDPLVAGACPNGWKCTAEMNSLSVFTCSAVDDELPAVLGGGECTAMNQCQQGFACLQYDSLLDYCDLAQGSCCAPMCDLSEEPSVCPPDLSCLPFYQAGSAPPGLEHVGICAAFYS